MQEPVVLGNFKPKKDVDMQSELSSTEDLLKKRRDEMRSHLHVTRELLMTKTTLKMIKKRREIVKLIYTKDYEYNEEIEYECEMRSLKHLTSPTSINVGLKTKESSAKEGMRFISDSLGHLASLTKISLFFVTRRTQFINDTTMRSLGDYFRRHTSLKSITIEWALNNSMTDEGMRSVCKSFRYLDSLNCLILKFTLCPKITDESLKCVAASFRHLTALTNITLCFRDCHSITDVGMSTIGDGLRNLTSLTQAYLRFVSINISVQAKETIRQDLKALKSLKSFEIY